MNSLACGKRTRAASVATALLLCLGSAVLGRDTPYDPDRPTAPPVAASTDACGLVETSFGDPDWVLVTSDRILRSYLCKASEPCIEDAWYDRIFGPCYSDNRYWKLPPDSGTAYAYSMSAMGIGSFDGLYIREGIKFQLFSGVGDGTPFGPAMEGPKFISIDYWAADACDGFEPGTFLVTGGPGALADYSLKIGGDVQILSLDPMYIQNSADQHTDKYRPRFVLRRGADFGFKLMVSREYGPDCYDVTLEAKHSFDGAEATIQVPAYKTPVPDDQWGAQWIGVTTYSDGTKDVEVKVHIPPTAPIGEYNFKVLVTEAGSGAAPDADITFGEPIPVLFNPWSATDAVFMGSDSDRDEYVLNTTGVMWQGEVGSMSAKRWRFAQFSTGCLRVTLGLLAGLGSADRASPAVVARHLSAMVNAEDGDNGILVGNWSGDYSGGIAPWRWSGSDQILKRYSTGGPVRYGQCWVFGGLLTTVLRAMGIPARPLTNFASAHDADSPPNKAVDMYFTADGRPDRARTNDSTWNYHVWCDAWMARADGGGDGWQAVDATPQERSGGLYQMGPASHTAINGNLGGAYDVDFVFAEVDADVKYWVAQAGGGDVLAGTDPDQVGKSISTKAVGGEGREDISASYKANPASWLNRSVQAALTESGLEVEFNPPANVAMGSNIVWTAIVRNPTATARTVHVVLDGAAVAYNGDVVAEAGTTDVTREVAAGGNETFELIVPESAYLAWTAKTHTAEVSLFVKVENTADVYAVTRRTVLIPGEATLTIDPAGPIDVGGSASVEVSYVNPLGSALTNAVATFTVGDGLSIDGESEVDVPVGTVGAGETLRASRSAVGVAPGSHLIGVTIQADQLSDVSADGLIEVAADCNHNGQPDSQDIAGGGSADCNQNGTPDECEADCNANGAPDDCDVTGGAPDCNRNRLPDSCDLAGGASRDVNQNGVPDECDTDCNRNGVPDDLDISRGTSADCASNGIPDECEDDCNVNGIADSCELDCNGNNIADQCEIAGGTLADADTDGIADVCDSCPNDGTDACAAKHPADVAPYCNCTTACGDWRIEMCEMTAYAAAWKRGDHEDQAGTARGAYLWASGEFYRWIASRSEWLPNPAAGAAGGGTGTSVGDRKLGRRSSAAGAVRRIERGDDGASLVVSVEVIAPAGALAVTLAEELPGPDWAASDISDDGVFDTRNAKIKWGPWTANLSRTVSYKLTAGSALADLPAIQGVVSFDGQNSPVAAAAGEPTGVATGVESAAACGPGALPAMSISLLALAAMTACRRRAGGRRPVHQQQREG